MKKKIAVALFVMSIITIIFINIVFGDTTTRAVLKVIDDGTSVDVSNSDIIVKQTISSYTDSEVTLKIEVENLQDQGTEVALVLDDSFSSWSSEKFNEYKLKMLDLVDKIYEKIPDAYISLSDYNGILQEMTGDKTTIKNAITGITKYNGINTYTGLNYAKNSFTGLAKNKHIVVFTDGEEKAEAKTVIEEIENNSEIYLTAIVMGDNASKQTEYRNTTRTKVITIEDINTYNFNNLNEDVVSNWICKKITKEMNDITIEGKYTEDIQEIFNASIKTHPSNGILISKPDGYTLTIPQMTSSKVTCYINLKLNNEIDRKYINSQIDIIKQTDIEYKDKRQKTKTINNTEKLLKISFYERYSLEITAINKEFQTINVSGVKCKVTQKKLDGEIIDTFENLTTNSNGKVLIDTLTFVGDSYFEIEFISTPAPYEDKEKVIVKINKEETTGVITINEHNLDITAGENVDADQLSKTIQVTTAIPPKAIVFNITKIDDESELPISGVLYQLTQPETENIPQDSVISGTTGIDGKTSLSAEVAGIRQTYVYNNKTYTYYYTYKLKEVDVPTGYIDKDKDTSVNVHFDLNGNISDVLLERK